MPLECPKLAAVKLIDPHIHCVSRTTDDYLYMARSGVVAVSEPAFWAGYDRSSASSFADYFNHLLNVEPLRAARYGIEHFAWLCINAKEAENVSLAREVIALIPPLLKQHPAEIAQRLGFREAVAKLAGDSDVLAEIVLGPVVLVEMGIGKAEIAQHRVPVSSLCIAASVPPTTALRWIKTMTDNGLFKRRADPHDGRRVFVELAPDGTMRCGGTLAKSARWRSSEYSGCSIHRA